MPRKRRSSKRRHEINNDVHMLLIDVGRRSWERYWGGPDEGRAAFDALRGEPLMHVEDGETYDAWLERQEGEWQQEIAHDPRDPEDGGELDFDHGR